MKYLIILTLLVLLAAVVYWRLRPYLFAARRVMETMRAIQSAGDGRPAGMSDAKVRAGEKLIRCESCGVWLPSSRALANRSSLNLNYCSTSCLEKSSAPPERRRKSAV